MRGVMPPLLHKSSRRCAYSEIQIVSLNKTVCILAKNLHVETAKYSINKNYSSLILINVKNSTYLCWMLGNFFRRLMDYKQRVNKEKKNRNWQCCFMRRTRKVHKKMLASLGLCVLSIDEFLKSASFG